MNQTLLKKQKTIENEKSQEKEKPLGKWRYLFDNELKGVDRIILEMTESKASLIPKLVGHIISSGGKRLRPILTIMAAKLCGYHGEKHLDLAACIEFIHTATLLHDDVVDESNLRRGLDTANSIWGNSASVLVGDFLLSRSFQLMARVGSLEVYKILSDTSAIITEGEVKQLMAINEIATTEEEYIDIITSKTAQLFSAACEVGAVVSNRSAEEKTVLREFGKNLGIAFQIIDDALDYSAKQEELGKTIGDDFREGKVTLPVIIAYKKGAREQKAFWERVISETPGEGDLEKAIKIVTEHDVLDETIAKAKHFAGLARKNLDYFPNSEIKSAMSDILEFSVNRPY